MEEEDTNNDYRVNLLNFEVHRPNNLFVIIVFVFEITFKRIFSYSGTVLLMTVTDKPEMFIECKNICKKILLILKTEKCKHHLVVAILSRRKWYDPNKG